MDNTSQRTLVVEPPREEDAALVAVTSVTDCTVERHDGRVTIRVQLASGGAGFFRDARGRTNIYRAQDGGVQFLRSLDMDLEDVPEMVDQVVRVLEAWRSQRTRIKLLVESPSVPFSYLRDPTGEFLPVPTANVLAR